MPASANLALYSDFGKLGYLNITFSRSSGTFTITSSTFTCEKTFYMRGIGDLSFPVTFIDKFGDFSNASGTLTVTLTTSLGTIFTQGNTYNITATAASCTRTAKSVSRKLVYLKMEHGENTTRIRTYPQGSTIQVYYATRNAASSYIGDQYARIDDYTSSVTVSQTSSSATSAIFSYYCWFECAGNNNGNTGSAVGYGADFYHHYDANFNWTHVSGDCLSYGWGTVYFPTRSSTISYTIPTKWNGSSTTNKYFDHNIDASASSRGDWYSNNYPICKVVAGNPPTISVPDVTIAQNATQATFSITLGNISASCDVYAKIGSGSYTKVLTKSASGTYSVTLTVGSATFATFYATSNGQSSFYVWPAINRTPLTLSISPSATTLDPGNAHNVSFTVGGNDSSTSFSIVCQPSNGESSFTVSGTGSTTVSKNWSAFHYKNNGAISFTCTLTAGSITASNTFSVTGPQGGQYIMKNSGWYYAIPYVYKNSTWNKAEAYVYKSGWAKTKT